MKPNFKDTSEGDVLMKLHINVKDKGCRIANIISGRPFPTATSRREKDRVEAEIYNLRGEFFGGCEGT